MTNHQVSDLTYEQLAVVNKQRRAGRQRTRIGLSQTLSQRAGFAEFLGADYDVTCLDSEFSTIDDVATCYDAKLAASLDVLLEAFERSAT